MAEFYGDLTLRNILFSISTILVVIIGIWSIVRIIHPFVSTMYRLKAELVGEAATDTEPRKPGLRERVENLEKDVADIRRQVQPVPGSEKSLSEDIDEVKALLVEVLKNNGKPN